MKISEHINYKEATGSPTAIRKGIDNTPNPIILKRMQLVANKVFEPLRNHFNVPIKVESFYRCEELNIAVGGSKYSQHQKGEAIDIDDDFGGLTNSEMFYYIANNLKFDQLIYEAGNGNNAGWIHVSYKKSGNRNKISIMYISKGFQRYKHFKNVKDFNNFKDKIYNT